jgi:hypothetical protein
VKFSQVLLGGYECLLQDVLTRGFKGRNLLSIGQAYDGITGCICALNEYFSFGNAGNLRVGQFEGCTTAFPTMGRPAGLEVIARLRASGNETPIILMSGSFSAELLESASGGAGVIYLPKPFSDAEIETEIEKLIGKGAS